MKKYILLLLLLSVFAIIPSCDLIDGPYTDEVTVKPDDSTFNRRALLIEFTGIKCPNCPDASAEGKRIIDKYKGRVFGMNIHATSLARPDFSKENQFDFRTSPGNEIFQKSNQNAVPSGAVSAFLDGNAYTNSFLSWESDAAEILSEEAEFEINLEKDEKLNIELEFFKEIEGNFRIAAYLVENNIIGYQLHNSTHIQDYKHNFVLREQILGDLGQDLDLTQIQDGKLMISSDLPEIGEGWNVENLNIVCFVYHSETGKIYQVNEIPYTAKDSE